MTRIANNAATTQLVNHLMRSQQSINKTQVQLTSDKVSQNYAGISRESERLVGIENSTSLIERFTRNNELMDLRLQISEQAIEGMEGTIDQFKEALLDFSLVDMTDEREVEIIQNAAYDSLRSLSGHLNTDINGEFLFAGSRTTTQPVDLDVASLAHLQTTWNGDTIKYPTSYDNNVHPKMTAWEGSPDDPTNTGFGRLTFAGGLGGTITSDTAGYQTDTIILEGTVQDGDQYTVTVDGNTVVYTVTGAEADLAAVRTNIITAINADPLVSAVVDVSAGAADGEIIMVADTPGTSFTASVTASNLPSISQIDTITIAGTPEAGDKYDFTVDGNPVSYTATGLEGSLAGLRTAITAAFNTAVGGIITATDNTADGEIKLTADTANSAFTTVVTGATNIGPVSQVDTVTLSGLYAAGDIVSVAVDGNPTVPYTVIADDLTVNGDGTGGAVAGDSTIAYNNITTKVAAAVNADGVSSGIVTAAASGGGGGVVTLTADTAGTAFAKSTSLTTATTAVATATTPTPNVVATAQVNNVTLTGTFSAGDDISINIDAIGAVVYTVTANDLTANGDGTGGVVAGNSAAAYNNITTQVAANLNADAPTGAVVTAAAPGGGGGVVTITADTAGTAFAQVTSDTSAGTATETTPTPNVAAVAQIDNATLTGAYSVGDTVSISVDGETVVYTVLADDLTANGDGTGGLVAGDSAAAYNNITAKIATGLNGSTPMAALVTAAAPGGGGGVVTLTGTTAGTSFTQTTTATRTRSGTITEGNTQANIVGLADNTASFVTTQVAEAGIQPAVAQVDNVTLTGTFVATDIVTVNVDSLGDISYTVTANDLTVNGDGTGGAATAAQMQANIATKVASAISDNATTSAVVTATSSGSAIVLTAVNAGTSFSTASSVTDSTSSGNNQTSVITTPTANFEGGIPAVAQVDNAAITGTFAATDTVSINIDSLGAVTYTVVADDLTVNGDGTGGVATAAQTRAHIATNLASLVNATAATAAVVTASVSSESIVLTADSAGTAFTLVTAATDVSGTVGGQASTGTTTTANAAAIISNTDNAATLQSVTATENPFSNIPVGASITIANATNSANNTTYTVAANTGSVITVASTQTVVSSSGNDLSSSLTITSDISYYSGDEVARTHKTSKTREFTMDTTAIDPAFEKAIRAMFIIAQGVYGTDGGLDKNPDRVEDALYLIRSALDPNIGGTPPYGTEDGSNITSIETDIAYHRILIDQTNQNNQQLVDYFDRSVIDVENIDQLATITRLLDQQQSLEASYQSMARIRQLSLINYL